MSIDPAGQELAASFERVRLRSLAGQWTDPVDLQLRKGGFYVLVGDDEVAKRSLLDLLTLRERVSGGDFHLLGQKANRPRPALVAALRRRIGVVQDALPLLPHLSVFDNVALPLRIAGVDERELPALVDEMLGLAALTSCANLSVPELSLQEACGVAMARAMIGRPEMLLVEDIFDRLTPDWSWRLLRLAESLRSKGAAIVVATGDDRLTASVPGVQIIRVSRPAEKVPFYRRIW